MNPVTISEEDFQKYAIKRVQPLLSLVNSLSQKKSTSKCLNRLTLSALLSQSTQIEEFLDFYGAKNNCRWASFRSLVATVKLFSDISYELLHIRQSVPRYRLLPIGCDFLKATDQTFAFVAEVLSGVFPRIIKQSTYLELPISAESSLNDVCTKETTPGFLPQNHGTCHIETASETVTFLATAFLNLSVEDEILHIAGRSHPQGYASYIGDSISEKKLRSLELEFHNLQSLYDTNVSDTDVESLDTNLPVLRGHISVVFHLLKTATAFAHYYERHMGRKVVASYDNCEPLVEGSALLSVLMDYSINYASRYIICAKELCQTMLKQYAEVDKIKVPVPQYRGFHVRPSTLISKIVIHYGSNVQMELGDERYDASSPLELFRANEKMNAEKRRSINKEVACTGLVSCEPCDNNVKDVVRNVVLTLVAKNKLLLYEQPLKLRDDLEIGKSTVFDKVIDEISRLQAIGKIDIETNLEATFIGDKRVLADIKLLVDCGYGEDNFGNNILLPEKLAYLRR